MTTDIDLTPLHTEIDPYDFEHLVATLWTVYGWRTTVTSRSHDGGIDVIASRSNLSDGPETLLIQAKAYAPENRVHSEEVRRYAALYRQYPKADKVVIVTTSSFTAPSSELAAERNVHLVNRHELCRHLQQSKLRFADLESVATRSSTNNSDWLWYPIESVDTSDDFWMPGFPKVVSAVVSRLRSRQAVESVDGPALLHPALPCDDQTCPECVTGTVHGFETCCSDDGRRRWKLCSACFRLYADIDDSWTLTEHYHPFDSNRVDLYCAPRRVDAAVSCPVCHASQTFWTADTSDRKRLLLCTGCKTAWEREFPTHGRIQWRCIERERPGIRVGCTHPQSAFDSTTT